MLTRARVTSAALAMALGAGQASAQAILDPSFEISGAAFQSGGTEVWTSFSTNFVAPYCDSSCLGPGQSGGAHSGNFWVWFGGTSDYEHGSVQQSVLFPGGAPQLRFYLRAYSDRSSNTDTLRVLVDSTVVFSINNQQILPYIADYVPVQINVAAFAGGTHTVLFDSVTQAATGVTNYFIDDVTFVGGTAPCYANCDSSTAVPFLNVSDFTCFLQKFAASNAYANCDNSTTNPVLNVSDFTCFLQKFAAGCSAP